jgi:hypothetical protein
VARYFHGTTEAAAESILARGLAAGSLVTDDLRTARDYAARRAAVAKERYGVVVAVSATDADVERGDWGHIGFVGVWRTLRPLRAELVGQVRAKHMHELGEQDYREGGGVSFRDPVQKEREF